MTPLENAVEIAAKGLWEDALIATGKDVPWEELPPVTQHHIRSVVLPAVHALADAGSLKEAQ